MQQLLIIVFISRRRVGRVDVDAALLDDEETLGDGRGLALLVFGAVVADPVNPAIIFAVHDVAVVRFVWKEDQNV